MSNRITLLRKRIMMNNFKKNQPLIVEKIFKPLIVEKIFKPLILKLESISNPSKKILLNYDMHLPQNVKNATSADFEFLFDKINVFVSSNIDLKNHKFQTFTTGNQTLIQNCELLDSKKQDLLYNYTLIINDNVGFEYLPVYKYSLIQLLEKCEYDIIELTVEESISNFESLIQEDIKIIEKYSVESNAFIISKQGFNKLLMNHNTQNSLLKNCKIGYLSRPMFYINNSLSKNFWYSFYRVTSLFKKVYCINLGFDIAKRNNMQIIKNILNCCPNNFFHNGILGVNLPTMDDLIKNQIFHPIMQKRYPKMSRGAIGLNITQRNLINESVEMNYERVLILEDDIDLPIDYFKVLDILFTKYQDIDILYLGYSNNENSIVLDKIDNIGGYDILKPKNICKKVCIGGFFGVIMSQNALKLYQTKINPIQDISDVWLCDLAFNIDYKLDGSIKKIDHQLNVIFIEQLCKVDTSKPSLTEENNFNFLDLYHYNKEFQYLSKIKKMQYMVNNNFCIKIYVSPTFKTYYQKFLQLFYQLFPIHDITMQNTQNCDIALYTVEDHVDVDIRVLNIIINGEKEDKKGNYDIGILTTFNQLYPINIYYPFLLVSLWERRQDYKSILHNSEEKFCAYMYNYDLEYRVNLFKLISTYKKVDALGKSQNNVLEPNDRSTYNNNATYNDLGVQKYSKYKFVLALENGITAGYITEKLINPILAGSIPIYAGPSDVFNLINKKRIIFVGDYKTNENALVEEVKRLDNDSQSYHEKVNQPIFVGNVNFNTFEQHLLNLLKPALGFIPKTITFSADKNADLKVKDVSVQNNNLPSLTRYLSDFMLPGDQIV